MITFGSKAAIVLLALFLVPAAHAATGKAKPGKAAAATNAEPAELPIPVSRFNIAEVPTKDPFFPLSQRQAIPTAKPVATFSPSLFVLKGVSGPEHHRLAIVNNRTVAAGEDAEVTTASGRVKIHCIDVKETAVVLRAGGHLEPLTIFLRKAAQ